MADSTNPFDIPAGQFNLVGGYVDGLYAWSVAGWNHHPQSIHVRIACFDTTLDAHVLDVESGCATVDQAMGWVKAKQARGEYPTLYFSIGLAAAIDGARRAAGLTNDKYAVWAASWDGVAEGLPYTIAKQYANPTLTGAHYDLSVVADYWPGVDALPPPPAYTGASGAVQGWSGLVGKVDSDLPAFGNELGVLASGLQSLG